MVSVSLSAGPLILAFVITVTEMTEVVALVFAVSSEAERLRTGALGAATGTAVIAGIALLAGAALQAVPHTYFVGAAAVVLGAFAVFLFRSTLRAYRKFRDPAAAHAPPTHRALHFASGFSVGAVEATEAVIVLVAIAAGGAPTSALVGALAGGGTLIVAALLVHERIRRIKVPQLKLGGTAMLFAFAVFWGVEALGLTWPGSGSAADLVLIPLFVTGVLIVRGGVALVMSRDVPVEPKG
ncbi:MAG TPA: hypothetical protein VJQ43_00140 [Thermoplasmata archaeon]|nr:hypothetical protein [Thermoplasmata archaeon]